MQRMTKDRSRVNPAHNPRFNHDVPIGDGLYEWALKKIEVNKIPNDRLEGVIRIMIKDLENDLLIKVEALLCHRSICYIQ